MASFTASAKPNDISKLHKEITVKLIADQNIPNKLSMSGDDIAEALVKLSHIRLDRLQISTIENLECLGPVTNLYLQQNYIGCIENLDVLTNLRFLTLAGNRIKKIENLKVLKQLKFLDLSSNLIENCETDELPHSLFILSLKDNPCTKNKNYRTTVTEALINLNELDEVPVDRLEQTNDDSNSSDEENLNSGDEEEHIDDFELEDSTLRTMAEDIVDRVRIRSLKQKEQHDERITELKISRQWEPNLV